MNLYKETDQYLVNTYRDRANWLKGRICGIGGSDASTLIGINPYKTPDTLWKEKKGLIEAKEVDNELVQYGKDIEPVLRSWFKATHKEFKVQYRKDCILQSKALLWRLYSPDGLLYHNEKGKGILEIKSTLIRNANMYDQWKQQMPQNYYVQVLHGLLTTGFDYVVVVAELRFAWERNNEIIVLEFTRDEVKDDLLWLDREEQVNYTEYYEKNIQPPVVIEF